MTHYRFLVESSAVVGREDEYHEWYDNQHTNDILRLPGVVSVQRFHVMGKEGERSRYYNIVDYESDDLPGLLETIKKRSGTPEMPTNPAIDNATVKFTVLEARNAPKTP
jgi:hypothetical protein